MAISRGEAAGSPGGQILLAQLRRCHMLRNEMHHFSTNLHHYVMFEARATAPRRHARKRQWAARLRFAPHL